MRMFFQTYNKYWIFVRSGLTHLLVLLFQEKDVHEVDRNLSFCAAPTLKGVRPQEAQLQVG